MSNAHKIIGKGFDKRPENINKKGRPKKLVALINEQLKKEGYSIATRSQILDAYQIIINLPYTKIKEIATSNNDDYPILYKLVARELLGKRGGEYLEKLLGKIIGKPKSELDLTMNKGITIIWKEELSDTDNKAN